VRSGRTGAEFARSDFVGFDLMDVTEQVLLADYTTLRLGGPARRFVAADSEAELVGIVREADAEGEPVLVLGGGSNLVVADEGFPGVVVQTAAGGVRGARAGDEVELTAAAGESWDDLVVQSVAEGLSGIECLSGIPGVTGATPIQNVNAYGQEVAQTITLVRAYDRLLDEVVTLTAAQCEFGYRTSMFKRHAGGGRGAALNPAAATGRHVVVSVTFRLTAEPLSAPIRYAELARRLEVAEGDRVPLAAAREAVLELRRGKGMVLDSEDPDTRSAGSFFTNPVIPAAQFEAVQARAGARLAGDGAAVRIPHWPEGNEAVKVSAAWLIERSGFPKGFPGHGPVRISTKHTLALTNPGFGSTASLISLARQVKAGVLDTFGIELMNEPVLVGTQI
jgi:UDP-N-acetylmuramate dehydrogenase